jgi:hypothetical protein
MMPEYMIRELELLEPEPLRQCSSVMPEKEGAGKFLKRWIIAREDARRFARKLADAQERVRALEAGQPWLRSVKGTLREKDVQSCRIPEGSRSAPVPSQTPPSQAPLEYTPSPAQNRGTPVVKRKREAAPMMEKPLKKATVTAKRRKAGDKPGALPAAAPARPVRRVAETPLEELEAEIAARNREAQRH